VIVWRVRGKIIRSVLCNIVCNNCAQCNAHTYEQIRFSFSVVIACYSCVRFSFLRLFCVIVSLCVCTFVVFDLVSSVLCQEIG